VEDDPIRIESRARIETLGFPPGEELFYVFASDIRGVRLRGDVFIEESQNMIVLLVGEGLRKVLMSLRKL
jgi:hypothetical protein